MMDVYYKWMVENCGEHMNNRGEINMTTLGEDCAAAFRVMTDQGDSEIEERIFEIASDVASEYNFNSF